MNQKNLVLGILAAVLLPPVLYAAPGITTFSGQICYQDGSPVSDSYMLKLPKLKRLQSTDPEGYFNFEHIPSGKVSVQVWLSDALIDSFTVAVNDSAVALGKLLLVPLSLKVATDNLPPPPDQNTADQFISEDAILPQPGILLNGNDLFVSNSFSFAGYGFKPRAYTGQQQEFYMGGLSINSPLDQQANFLLWSGLGESTKAQAAAAHLDMSSDGVGGLNGTKHYLLHAQYQTPQRKLAYAFANRSYDHRIQLFYCPERTNKGMMYACSAMRQWAKESLIPGTGSDQYGVYGSVAKEISTYTTIAASFVYQNSYREPRSAATEEVYRLAGTHYYNANWGWQQGIKRNARSLSTQTPMLMLQCEYHPSERTHWTFASGMEFLRQASTGIDWQDAPDPRPDYYRNLPAFLRNTNPAGATETEALLKEQPQLLQLNWNKLYEINNCNFQTHNYTENGVPNSITGKRSLYILAADIEQQQTYHFRTHVRRNFNDNTQGFAAVAWNFSDVKRFKRVEDLLGGDYFLNHNTFAQQTTPQNPSAMMNDLNLPDREVRQHDVYKYNYQVAAQNLQIFAQIEKNLRHWTLFSAAEISMNSFRRNGIYRNGLFPQSSFGKGQSVSIPGFALKNGITWKINGRHYLSIKGLWNRKGQNDFDQLFIAPALREQIIPSDARINTTVSAELSYAIHAPRWHLQLNAYQTERLNTTQILRYYNDEPEYQCFVNLVQTHLNIRHTGFELAAFWEVNSWMKLHGVCAMGQSYFASNPSVTVYSDNDTSLAAGSKKVNIKNYYAATGPQTIAGLGCQFSTPKRWSLKINIGYADRNYVRINPSRRSASAAENIASGSDKGKLIFNQERLPAAIITDLMLSKSFRIRKHANNRRDYYQFFCYLSAGNLLNNTNVKLSGYEQLRYNFTDNDPATFPNKYLYATGRNFSMGVNFKW